MLSDLPIEALRRCGDNAAFHLPDQQVLAKHCALCNQWITCTSKMKQHFRLSHAHAFREFMRDAGNPCSKFNSPGSPCPHCGSKSKVPRQHPSQCTVLWQICLLRLRGLRYGLGNVRMLRAPSPGPRRDDVEGASSQQSRTQGGQVTADRERKGSGTPTTTLHGYFTKRTSATTRTGLGSSRGSESAGQTSHPAGDLHQGLETRHVLGDLRTTGTPEFPSTPVQSRTSLERQSTKECRESAPSERLDHLPHGTPLEKVLEDLKGPLLEKAQSQGWLTDQTWSPSMGALVVNPDKAPVPTQQIVKELKEIIPLLSVPYMIHRFHANRAMKETSDRVSAFQLEVSGRTEGSRKVWLALETLSNCSVLQIIGIQLRRDSLRRSPAPELVQKLISNS